MSERRGRIREEMKARILAAAEAVFAAKGLEGATTAGIALEAGLPKANIHYYYPTKEALYRAVLGGILHLWLAAFDAEAAEDDPGAALASYIALKMRLSHERPLASRVFAREVMRGAPLIRDFLEGELRQWVEARACLLRRWAAEGRMDAVDPVHLFFMLWAVTQTYADFDSQICAVQGKAGQTEADLAAATAIVTGVLLKGCGIRPPPGADAPAQRTLNR